MVKERNQEILKKFIGKKVLILTQNDYVYNANILEVEDDFVRFLDKYNKEIALKLTDIKQVTSENVK
jgi:small nuclear ribonucleoprotein (snRNP)-like protein